MIGLWMMRLGATVLYIAGLTNNSQWMFVAGGVGWCLSLPIGSQLVKSREELKRLRAREERMLRKGDEDTDSWLRAIKVEYVNGDLTIEEYEDEVERYLALGEKRQGTERHSSGDHSAGLDWSGV